MLKRLKKAFELFDQKVAFDIEYFGENALQLALSLMEESLYGIVNKNNSTITTKLRQIEAYTLFLASSDLADEI